MWKQRRLSVLEPLPGPVLGRCACLMCLCKFLPEWSGFQDCSSISGQGPGKIMGLCRRSTDLTYKLSYFRKQLSLWRIYWDQVTFKRRWKLFCFLTPLLFPCSCSTCYLLFILPISSSCSPLLTKTYRASLLWKMSQGSTSLSAFHPKHHFFPSDSSQRRRELACGRNGYHISCKLRETTDTQQP